MADPKRRLTLMGLLPVTWVCSYCFHRNEHFEEKSVCGYCQQPRDPLRPPVKLKEEEEKEDDGV